VLEAFLILREFKTSRTNTETASIGIERGDETMSATKSEYIEELALTRWLYNVNEEAYKRLVITDNMYEYARNELQESLDNLSRMCYSTSKSG